VEKVIQSLEENLKELYRKAVDADAQINELKKQGHGKFESVFKNNALFTVSANKFMPYLEETAEQILELKSKDLSEPANQEQLETVVKKLHLLHTTLSEFKTALN